MNSVISTSRFRLGLRSVAGLAVLTVFATSFAAAQDKATLDLLVKKGVITQSDADDVAKSAAAPVVVTPKDTAVKGLKLEGLIQTQFDWITTSDKVAGSANPPATEQFFIRRAYLGALADLGNGWTGEAVFDFAAGLKNPSGYQSNGSNASQNSFEKIIITKKVDDFYGAVTAGYQKVNFTQEEYTSSAAVKPIERSVVSRFFDEAYKGDTSRRLGFADRHNGIFWDGKLPGTGLAYGVAVTTGIQNSIAYAGSTGATTSATYTGGLNRLGTWAYVNYTGTLGDFGYKAGVNFGYSADGNSIQASATSPFTQSNSVWGYNPVLSLTYGKHAQLDAEFIQTSVTNGRQSGTVGTALTLASPFGFTVTPSYKINDNWELVARYSYLNTDGRGVAISNVVVDGADAPIPAGTAAATFNDVQSYYVGLNWYPIGTPSIKFGLGYEFSQFNNRATAVTSSANGSVPYGLTGPRANVSGARARLSLLF
jgi:phosphate-selective porin